MAMRSTLPYALFLLLIGLGVLALPQGSFAAPGTEAPSHYCANRPCSYDGDLSCQCDDECGHFGDCCPDFEEECAGDITPQAPATTADGVPAHYCAIHGCFYDPDSSCQCDDVCPGYGDCCPDYVAQCTDAQQHYCANRPCSYDADLSCQCDGTCSSYGDCCPDYADTCSDSGATADPVTTNNAVSTAAGTACGYSQVALGADCVQYTWESSPSAHLPTPPLSLAEISAVVIGHHMIVFGDGDLGSLDNRYTLAFNLHTHTWESPYNRAQRPFWGDHTTVEVYDGELYAFAGLCCQTFCSGCGATSKVQIYNPGTDEWRQGTPIPWNVNGAMSSAIIDGKMYVCGGLWNNWPSPNCGVYVPATDSWLPMPNMPKPMHHTAAGTDGTKLYIFGGRQGGNGLSEGQDDVQIYDPVTNTWQWDKTSFVQSMPTGRTGMGKAVYLHGEFYLMGGEYFPNDHPKVLPSGVFDLVEIYNPATNTWREGPPMPTGLHGLHPVIHNSMIYIAGGGDKIDRGTSQTFQRYKPA